MQELLKEMHVTLRGIHHEIANLTQWMRLALEDSGEPQPSTAATGAHRAADEALHKLTGCYHRCEKLEVRVRELEEKEAAYDAVIAEREKWELVCQLYQLRLEIDTLDKFQSALVTLESKWTASGKSPQIWQEAVETFQEAMWEQTLEHFRLNHKVR